MTSRLLVATLCALVAASAAAVIIEVQDIFSSLDAIAGELELDLGLPAAGLAAYWPAEVDAIGSLAPVGARLGSPAKLNALLGSGSSFARGDVVVLTATADSSRWRAELFTTGGSWRNPDLTICKGCWVQDYFSGCSEAGVRVPPKKLASLEGAYLVGTVSDPAAFEASFGGRLETGATVILMPGPNGTRAVAAHGSDMPFWGFEVDAGKVELIR